MHTTNAVERKGPKALRDAVWHEKAITAILHGDMETLAALRPEIAANSILKAPEELGFADEIALMKAISTQNLKVVQWFLEKSARDNIDVKKIVTLTRQKRTALMVAAAFGNVEIVKALIPASAVKALDKDGDDALLHAASSGSPETVLELLPICDAKRHGGRGATALMVMASEDMRSQEEAFRALLAASDPLSQDEDGDTALMWAARWGYLEAVMILLPHSDPKHKNSMKKTAFDYALTRDDNVKAWATLDVLADTAPRKKVDEVFKGAPAGEMPRWAARVEAEALAAAMAMPDGALESPAASKRKPDGAKRV